MRELQGEARPCVSPSQEVGKRRMFRDKGTRFRPCPSLTLWEDITSRLTDSL